MNTQEVYKNVHKIQVSEEARDGILGLIDIQTNSGIQKVLDKMDNMKAELKSEIKAVETKMDAMETKMNSMETKMNSKIDITASKIKTTNILATGIVIAIVAGIVMSFFNRQ